MDKLPVFENWLGAYGQAVGRRPCTIGALGTLVCVGLSLGWLQVSQRDIMRSTDEFELMWTHTGSSMEQEIKWVKELHKSDAWASKPIMTLFKGKGDYEDADLVTPELFAEMLPLYKRFHTLSVTTSSGLVYSSRDLCARGSMPDYPGDRQACELWQLGNMTDNLLAKACMASPILPCMITTPLDCFNETVQVLDPSYAPLDLVADVHPDLVAMGAVSYAARPSWRSLTAEQMKATVSQRHNAVGSAAGQMGCPWWTRSVVFSPTSWGGGLEWSGDTLIKASALRWSIFTEGPRRAAFRMRLSKPQHANEAEIKEAIELLDKAWHKEVEVFADSSKRLEVVNIDLGGEDRAINDSQKPQILAMALGGLAMNLFITFALAHYRNPLLSRVTVGLLGLLPVCLGISASGGFLVLIGLKLNVGIVMSLPFLALGLGVNDLFVIIRYFSGLGLPFITEKEFPDILAEVFRQAGVGVTLTSLCNIFAFCAGCLLPVEAMADFCVAAAVVAGMNYFVMLTIVPSLLLFESQRIKRQLPEPSILVVCHMLARRNLLPCKPTTAETEESALARFLERKAGPALSRPRYIAAVFLMAASFFAVCVVSITEKTVGYKPHELIDPSDPLHRGLELLFSEFTTWPSMLCFVDVDVPNQQQDMLQLYEQVTRTETTEPFESLPYLSSFYNYIQLASMAPAPEGGTMADAGWRLYPSKWKHDLLAPQGVASVNADEFYTQYAAWNSMPLDDPSQALKPGNNAFVMADFAFVNEFSHAGDGVSSPLRFSFFRFYQTGLDDLGDYMKSITEVRDIVDNSPLKGKAFPYGPIFTFWSVFEQLEGLLLRALALDLAAVFLCTLVLLRSPSVALMSTAAVALIVFEVYGLGMMFLQFNIFMASAMLACAGMAVEFTAHLAAAFALEGKGMPTEKKLGRALALTGPAVIQGSLSTLCGIIPMALSPIPFVSKYLFAPFALIVFVGMFNGLIVLPALLATYDRCCALFENWGKPAARKKPQTAPAAASSSSSSSAAASSTASAQQGLPTVLASRALAEGEKETRV